VSEVIHIAGYDLQVGNQLRQRCAWCGATLVDYDLERTAVWPADANPRPSTWPVGSLVAIDGIASYTVEHTDGDPLPDGCCGKLDPEVTK
jgi:hypothetical protein